MCQSKVVAKDFFQNMDLNNINIDSSKFINIMLKKIFGILFRQVATRYSNEEFHKNNYLPCIPWLSPMSSHVKRKILSEQPRV